MFPYDCCIETFLKNKEYVLQIIFCDPSLCKMMFKIELQKSKSTSTATSWEKRVLNFVNHYLEQYLPGYIV